ncbi:unnamed protein product [Phytophthora fragariaefolia]|uniref:Unnamed protein product n=1 Tax=Phytophthora fragariaefolia TaxID=1490495 RepID=A0A9W6Y9E2_9STRA|nr:unnamed protein product [Phytophthora fragariaefolia]
MARYKKGHNQSNKRKHQKASDVKVSSTSTPAPPPVTAIDTSLFFSPAEAESFAKLQVDFLRQVKTAKRVLGKFRKETFWIKDESIEAQVDRQLNLAFLNLLEYQDNIAAKLNSFIRQKPQQH